MMCGISGFGIDLGGSSCPGEGVGSAMSALARLLVATAICGSALLASDATYAASIDITGGSFGAFPGYSGSNITKNNVINYDPSGIDDNKGGSAWHIGGAVIAKIPFFAVDWYFNGAESGDKIKFTSGSVYFTESDQNNRYSPGNDPGFKFIGTSTGSGVNTPISFTLLDTNSNVGVTNGVNNHLPG